MAANAPIKKAIPVNETKSKSKSNSAPPMKLTANDNDVIANAKVHYGKKDLEFFKTEIFKQREEAKEEFDIISHQLLDTSGEYDVENQSFSLHTAEQGSDAMEREKQYLQAQRTSDFIKKLDEALERIDRGTYGICVICGELIEKQRLLAVPITQKHVACKNKTQAKKFVAGEQFAPAAEETVE
jgi:RNA polymerase-binding transcription factor DksA